MRYMVANMKAQLSQVHWGLVLMMAVVIYIFTLILGLGLSLLLQAFQNVGHIDSQSAFQALFSITAFLVIVVTGYGAFLIAHKLERAAALHGFLVGLIVALLSLLLDFSFRRELTLAGLVLYVLMIVAGLLGGGLGSKRR